MISFLIANLEHGGRSEIMVPSSDGCWACPSIFVGIVSAAVLLDCELLKGRDCALRLYVVSFWNIKASIKVELLCTVF